MATAMDSTLSASRPKTPSTAVSSLSTQTATVGGMSIGEALDAQRITTVKSLFQTLRRLTRVDQYAIQGMLISFIHFCAQAEKKYLKALSRT
jgi:urease accessory protein UreF